MKVKKLNLRGISDILSNNELKNVIGGCGGGTSTCDGKTTFLKCTDANDNVISEWQSTGCPSANPCTEGLHMSCSC